MVTMRPDVADRVSNIGNVSKAGLAPAANERQPCLPARRHGRRWRRKHRMVFVVSLTRMVTMRPFFSPMKGLFFCAIGNNGKE